MKKYIFLLITLFTCFQLGAMEEASGFKEIRKLVENIVFAYRDHGRSGVEELLANLTPVQKIGVYSYLSESARGDIIVSLLLKNYQESKEDVKDKIKAIVDFIHDLPDMKYVTPFPFQQSAKEELSRRLDIRSSLVHGFLSQLISPTGGVTREQIESLIENLLKYGSEEIKDLLAENFALELWKQRIHGIAMPEEFNAFVIRLGALDPELKNKIDSILEKQTGMGWISLRK